MLPSPTSEKVVIFPVDNSKNSENDEQEEEKSEQYEPSSDEIPVSSEEYLP